MRHYGGLYVVCIWTQTEAAEPAPVVPAVAAKVAEDEEKGADTPEDEAVTPADPVAEDEVC